MIETFRDPAGSLSIEGDEVRRQVHAKAADEVADFLASDLARGLIASGKLVDSEVIGRSEDNSLILRHPKIEFPTYPWEWCPSQWIRAATLTLDLCQKALPHGFILKDATPLNVLFSGSVPIFVDVLSFERRNLESPLWLAYGQFVRTFLLPLVAYKYLGWPLAATAFVRDGYEPADLTPHLASIDRWRSPLLSLVTLPALFERGPTAAVKQLKRSSEFSQFAIGRTIKRLRKILKALSPSITRSRWSEYVADANHYSREDRERKQKFVQATLDLLRPARVLDIGANTGQYSRIAAKSGAKVVSWDTDVTSTDLNCREAARNDESILPIVADVARPTPAVGWRNQESPSLLQRSYKQFDCILALGLLHHILVSDQIPLAYVADLFRDIVTKSVIVEWIPRDDSQFVSICHGRDDLYVGITEDWFIAVFSQHFNIRSVERLSNGRSLYWFELR